METKITIVIPDPAGGIVEQYKKPDWYYERLCLELYGSCELVQNVELIHDEFWRERFFSLENARSQNGLAMELGFINSTEKQKYIKPTYGFWTFVGFLFVLAQFGWFFIWTKF